MYNLTLSEALNLKYTIISDEIEFKALKVQTANINEINRVKDNYLAAALITGTMINLEKLVNLG